MSFRGSNAEPSIPQELPPLDYRMAVHEQCDERERQLRASLAREAELKAELAILRENHDALLEAVNAYRSGTLTSRELFAAAAFTLM